jgi:class 3 adenylate cyclase
MRSPIGHARAAAAALVDEGGWWTAREVVDAVRYRPTELALALACAAGHAPGSLAIAPWLVTARIHPAVQRLAMLPHVVLRGMAAIAGLFFGSTASALVRWYGGAVASLADDVGARSLHRVLGARVRPSMLVPHVHDVAVLAVDMRGFTRLTSALADTPLLADLVSEYLTALTGIVERHRGVVFQYTGDGLIALFLPELAGADAGDVVDHLVDRTVPAMHDVLARLYESWQRAWQSEGRRVPRIGLGSGVCYGRATLGFLGPSGKKHVGVIGEPVNLAVFLCSQAPAGTLLVDRGSFVRAGAEVPAARLARLRSKKPHQRIEAVVVDCRPPRAA